LFSSSNFNDAIKRLSYLKTYRQYREQQAGRIQKANEVLDAKAKSLTVKRGDKKNALTEQNNQMNQLEQDKRKKDQALNVIKSQESQLSASIAKKEKQRQQNAANISRIIREEIAAAKRREQERLKAEAEARKKAELAAKAANQNNAASTASTTPAKKKVRTPSVLEETPEGLITSQEFERNKGSLPWPVAQGTIIIPFGNYTIPGTKIKSVSEGVTIETSKGASVKSIFQGEVSDVSKIGGNQSIIIKHGKYFTSYANLSSVSVSRGQKVNTGQAIGSAGEDDDGTPEVSFFIYTEHGPVNPSIWIRR
jgi:murein hydrolase activator